MSTLGPLDHIARTPLPWRTEPDLTECGQPIHTIDPARVFTREQVKARINNVGQQRAAYTTCMTCVTTSDRYPQDFVNAVYREANAVHRLVSLYSKAMLEIVDAKRIESNRAEVARRGRFSAELEAIAALVMAHRSEFDAYLTGLHDTVKLADHRDAKRAQRRYLGGAS